MKILIEQDMEGVAGILAWSYDLQRAGKLDWATRVMTDEVNAAVEGAIAEGATQVLVMEAHPFEYERLHPQAEVVRATVFDIPTDANALFFVGRHAMNGTVDGILNHTGSSRSIREVRVNGRPFGELGLTAAWFGGHGIPVALVTGDEAACREGQDFCGEIETVAVKRGIDCHQGISLSHAEACKRIGEGARRAMKRIGECRPFTVQAPVTLEVEYRHSEVTDWICRVPSLERVGPYTTRFQAKDYEAALRMYYAQGAMLARFDMQG